MRYPKDQKDTQNAIRELNNFKDKLTVHDWDMHGRKVTNAAPATNPTDYVILSQLPVFNFEQTNPSQYYSIPFNSTGTVTKGDIIAPFIVGLGREATFFAVMLAAKTPPTTTDLTMNVQIKVPPKDSDNDDTKFEDVLKTDITLPMNHIGPVVNSDFLNPGLKVGYKFLISPTVVKDGAAAFVTIQLIMKRIEGTSV